MSAKQRAWCAEAITAIVLEIESGIDFSLVWEAKKHLHSMCFFFGGLIEHPNHTPNDLNAHCIAEQLEAERLGYA